MSTDPKTAETLVESKARLAGSVAAVLALVAMALTAIGLIAHLSSAARWDTTGYLFLLTALFGIGVVAGVQLLRGGENAQQFLLVYWIGIVVAAAVVTLAVILWKVPDALAEAISEGGTPAGTAGYVALVGVIVLVLGSGTVALLAQATRPGTRQRYGSMAIVSVGVAAALVVAINLLGQYEDPEKNRRNYIHWSMETLGRYGLSDRSKKVLRDIKTPVHLTCVYTSTDEAKQTPERRQRLTELLEEMKIYGKDVTVANVTTDAGKAKLLDHLRRKLGGQAGRHDEFLRTFQTGGKDLLAELATGQQKWQAYPRDSYINLWGLSGEIVLVFNQATEKLTEAQEKVDQGLRGPGLPDYDALTRDIKDAAKDAKEALDRGTEILEKIGEIAQAVTDPNTQATAKAAIDGAAAAVKAMVDGLGAPDSAAPAKPAEVLARHVAAAKKAADAAVAAAGALDGLAGKDNAELLQQARPFSVVLQVGGPMPVSVSVGRFYRLIAQNILTATQEAEAVLKNAKPDYQQKYLVQLRADTRDQAALAAQAKTAAQQAIQAVTTVDPTSKADLALAKEGKTFGAAMDKLKTTLDAVEDLPELEDTSLSRDITGENIVIVEVGEKAEVVGFDDVWPLRTGQTGMANDQPQNRVFNGDAAIGSRVLKMTSEPFATVLLTYWDPMANMPPQMRQMQRTPPSDIPRFQLSTVRKRLEEANFKVEDWNLTEDMPDANDPNATRVLLVLPPPPAAQPNPMQRMPQQMPKFGDAERQKVLDAVNGGTAAIFLVKFFFPRQTMMFMPPTSTPYAYGEYLRNEWGIDPKTDYLVVPAVTDDRYPGRFKVDGQRFSYLPLSSFTDHPIGKPLQAQRVLWTNLCPIARKTDARGDPASPPEGVRIEPLLTVPDTWRSTWATSRIQELLAQFRAAEGSYIWPQYERGDLPVPFDVAVAATRTGGREEATTTPASRPQDPDAADESGKRASRIVVLATSEGLMDGYVDREVAVRDAKGTISLTDPPRANADLLVNSAYWLIGREKLIAAGPALATMKEIPEGVRLAMIVVYCVVLPLVVAGAGGVVMLRRRR